MKCLFLIYALSSLSISAPDEEVKGKVIDRKTQEPLVGVSVALKDNPTVGTITDLIGLVTLVLIFVYEYGMQKKLEAKTN